MKKYAIFVPPFCYGCFDGPEEARNFLIDNGWNIINPCPASDLMQLVFEKSGKRATIKPIHNLFDISCLSSN